MVININEYTAHTVFRTMCKHILAHTHMWDNQVVAGAPLMSVTVKEEGTITLIFPSILLSGGYLVTFFSHHFWNEHKHKSCWFNDLLISLWQMSYICNTFTPLDFHCAAGVFPKRVYCAFYMRWGNRSCRVYRSPVAPSLCLFQSMKLWQDSRLTLE